MLTKKVNGVKGFVGKSLGIEQKALTPSRSSRHACESESKSSALCSHFSIQLLLYFFGFPFVIFVV